MDELLELVVGRDGVPVGVRRLLRSSSSSAAAALTER